MKLHRLSRMFAAGAAVLLLALPVRGASAEVFVTPARLVRAADHIPLSSARFSEAYTRAKERRLDLADRASQLELNRTRRASTPKRAPAASNSRYFDFKADQAERMMGGR